MNEQKDDMVLESDEYQKGYQSVVLDFQNQMTLRSKKVVKANKTADLQAPHSQPKKSEPKAEP